MIYQSISEIFDRVESEPLEPIWISLTPREKTLARARELDSQPCQPLLGVPFAVKDNIDVASTPTTAGCPEFSYTPHRSAYVVRKLEAAGAVAIGKTNLDQFATGLVGTRTPYGACSSVFNEHYISGGSSSGSAVAVAKGLVRFALGTDTSGSSRIPAAFNNLIGLKPTRGLLSSTGVVPACRTLDSVSILARSCHDAQLAFHAARGFDANDPFSRTPAPGDGATPWLGGSFRFGVPREDQLQFFGDEAYAELYRRAIAAFRAIGGECVRIDFSIFREAAKLLYEGPWVAERLAAISSFFQMNAGEIDPIVRGIISDGQRHSAVNSFQAQYRLMELRRAAEVQWRAIDVMMLPTAPTIYTLEQIHADPIKLNSNLGIYTTFVNLMDLAAVSVPAGFRPDGLPFGVSLVGPAFSDDSLLHLADRYHRSHSNVEGLPLETPATPPGCVNISLPQGHLWSDQLIARGARLARTSRTSSACDIEIWSIPASRLAAVLSDVTAGRETGEPAIHLNGDTNAVMIRCK